MKLMRDSAETRMFHGVIAHAPRIAQMYCPRRMLIYLGRRAERSVATEMELAEMFTPIEAIKNAAAQKNAPALPPFI